MYIFQCHTPSPLYFRCLQLLNGGMCTDKHLTEVFYYNRFSQLCQPFSYTGCQGNDNRFPSKDECLDVCVNLEPTTPAPITPAPNYLNERCREPLDDGNKDCDTGGSYTRYYWDGWFCVAFVWRGCEGNNNRFVDRYECLLHCKEDWKEPKPQEDGIPDRCVCEREREIERFSLTRTNIYLCFLHSAFTCM